MPVIEVERVLQIVAEMQRDLEAFNTAELAALEKRTAADAADQLSEAARQQALASIAAVQTLLAEIQLRNQPQPVAEIEPSHPLTGTGTV